MEISNDVLVAGVGAAIGSIVTAVVSFVLHRRSLAHERRLAREKVDWDFLSTTLPILSRFFSKTTPDRVSSENDVFLMIDEVYSSLREGTFRGIFAGTGDTAPIASNVRSYSELLNKYVRNEITRDNLELHRKRALVEVSVYWKEIFPKDGS